MPIVFDVQGKSVKNQIKSFESPGRDPKFVPYSAYQKDSDKDYQKTSTRHTRISVDKEYNKDISNIYS